jgi:flavorubredoxin
MAWRPSKRMKEFLAGIAGSSFAGKTAAAFDTQMRSAVSGNATKHMEKVLTELGFRIVAPALIAYVENENKAYRLKSGELDKAKAWGRDLAKALAK